MKYIKYEEKRFSDVSKSIIMAADEIIRDYAEDGYNLTLRQLYYQFVSRDDLPESWADRITGSTNNEASYKKLGSIINNARLAGLLAWDGVVDRTRSSRKLSTWESPDEIIETAIDSYAIDKWKTQKLRPEVWVEKEALADVVGRAAFEYQVSYFVCKGYVSQSAMWEAAQRMQDQPRLILYLGDHDPSGLDMDRDVRSRLEMFGAGFTFLRIALDKAQIEEVNAPPNPAKITDSRARAYIDQHGDESWELDALPPQYLHKLIVGAIKYSIGDKPAWSLALEREKNEAQMLKDAAKDIRGKL